MKTEIIKLDINNPDMDKLRYAASVIKSGGLVAFPTETVYGLGANALDETAVRNIFKAKGRPGDNPLIVHIAERTALSSITSHVPQAAYKLMDLFWPGPLTLIMDKAPGIPDAVTAGLDTVGIRMPSHPIARALIREAGLPIAAPSANISGRPSPTSASHVIEDLSGRIDVIIDAGFSNVGLESTVLDVKSFPPVILRPGGVTPEQIKEALGDVSIDPALTTGVQPDTIPKAPGMKYTHYSPKADVIIVEGSSDHVIEKIRSLAQEYSSQGLSVGILATDETIGCYSKLNVLSMGSRKKPETIAASLFNYFRRFDHEDVDIILAEAVNNTGIGLAIMNRMSKAAGYNIIRV